jgi:probable F420-dependent oxidoreductase
MIVPDIGLGAVTTHESIPPAELGRWAEDNGFESLWFGEHSHIPTSRKSPSPLGGELPEFFKHFYDQFIALTAAAAVTTRLKVGTGVCLVPEHHTINLAKAVASLDRVSNGRCLFGIGAGWNAEEMADHGVEFKHRWKVARERILAMREIWNKDVAEYHGQFVNFDATWCWPKPIQAGGPPMLMGAASKWVPQRIAEYCDGWCPIDSPGADFTEPIKAVRSAMAQAGRSSAKLDLTIQILDAMVPAGGLERRIEELFLFGFNRVVIFMTQTKAAEQRPVLERYAQVRSRFV